MMGDEIVQHQFAAIELGREVISIAFEALSVAMRAKTSEKAGQFGRPDTSGLTMDAVDALRARAEEQLPRGHDLRAAILTFATMYEVEKYDPAAVVVLGDVLGRAVHEFVNPPVAQRFRADIDG